MTQRKERDPHFQAHVERVAEAIGRSLGDVELPDAPHWLSPLLDRLVEHEPAVAPEPEGSTG